MSTITSIYSDNEDVHHHALAVPSWVTAGTIAENATFVHKQNIAQADTQKFLHPIAEIGLCFFETASCLAYNDEDLPASLSSLAFTWHVHFPSDLPWHEGGATVADIAIKLMNKVSFLHARHAVLHPPLGHKDDGVQALQDFIAVWVDSGRAAADIHIENIDGHDLISLWPTIVHLGCKVCLDTGHLLCYGQDALLSLLMSQDAPYYSEVFQHIGMVHLCATEPSGRHAPLTTFTAEDLAIVGHICRHVPKDATLMLELFKWSHVEASREVLQNLLKEK